jgi:HlyD family secretion protein
MRKFLLPALILAGLAAVVFLSLRSTETEGKKVETDTVGRRTVSSRVKASGEITPEKKVEISAKVTGEIVALPVKEGDTVREGQVLVRIEDDLYRAARDQAEAALRQAEVALERAHIQLQDAERTLKRTRHLFQQGLASQQQMDQAEVAYQNARVDVEAQKHQVDQYRSSLKRTEDDLARTVIRSPMDGMVIQLNAERGETVVPGTTNLPGSVIMTIADMSRLLAEVDVGEVDVVNVALGQPAEVRVDALGESVQQGEVVEIATSGRQDSSQGVIRFQVKIAINDPDRRLRPSMTAKVNILTAEHADVLAVPIQAVVKRHFGADGKELPPGRTKGGTEKEVVYVVKAGKAAATPVETGISDDLWVEIRSGLQEGAKVVSGPYKVLKTLRDGDAVNPKAEPDEDGEEDAAKVKVRVG